MNQPTQGEINRKLREEKNALERKQKEQLKKNSAQFEKYNSLIQEEYEKVVKSSYVKTFNDNYGFEVDVNSVASSLTFANKNSNGNLPTVVFDNNNVKFKSDFDKERKKFNENSYSDFISNEDIIGNEIDNDFFTPTSSPNYDEKRFDYLSTVTKTLGYQTVEETNKKASKDAEAEWSKVQDKVTSALAKKMNIKIKEA